MRPLLYILNVWVAYLVCCQVMCLCIGLHVRTGWPWACVDHSSRKKTCIAENFLWWLTKTNSWKQSVTKGPLAQGFWSRRGWQFEEAGLWAAKVKGWMETWLFISSWYHHKVSPPASYLWSVLSDFTLGFVMLKQAPQKERVCNCPGSCIHFIDHSDSFARSNIVKFS